MKAKVSDLRYNASGMRRVICMIIVVEVYKLMDLLLGKVVLVSINKNDLYNNIGDINCQLNGACNGSQK